MQLFHTRRADAGDASFCIEKDLPATGGERPPRDHQPAAALGRFELQRQAARQVLDDLLAHPADAGIGLERHASLLQSACLACRRTATSDSKILLRNSSHAGRARARACAMIVHPTMATILVADDTRANREALAALLESAGHEVLRTVDGREALERARETRPDLVISDVLMPMMDGYELARRLKADPVTATTALMFYTAYFGGQDAQALAQAHGVSRVLLKPSDNDEILRQVDAVLASRNEVPAEVPENLDQEHLRVMVDQLLEKTGALEVQQRRIGRLNRTLEVLSAVNAVIVRAADRQALLEEACRIAVEKGGFRLAAIGLADPRTHAIRQVAAAGAGSAERDFARLKLGTRSLIWNDAQSGSFVALPLLAGGETAGILLLYARQRDFFDEEEMRLLHELAGDIAFALRHLAQKARMDYLAYHDSLTDLPNRSLFTDRMTQAPNAARS